MSTDTTHHAAACEATSSLEWLREYVADVKGQKHVRVADYLMLQQVAEQLDSARYTIASKSATLDYITRLHTEACAQLGALRAKMQEKQA